MNKCLDWFRSHDPSDGNVPQLPSLSSRLASSEGYGINYDETKTVGSDIQRRFDSVYVRHATIKGHHMVHTVTELKSDVKAVEQTVQIDHSILFLRCTALAQPENQDITTYFAHGMTPVPTFLFRDFFIVKVDKSELGRELKKNTRKTTSDYATQRPPDSMPVIDGGWLLNSSGGKYMLQNIIQTCWDSTVPFSGQRIECAVCCLMGTKSTQPKITNTGVVILERCQQQ